MSVALIDTLFDRAEIGKQDSDFSYFFDLLLLGEALSKTIVVAMLSGIDQDVTGHRYRLGHKLVRANGLGDWAEVLNDALSGPASQYLIDDAQPERMELTRNCSEGEWQYNCVSALKRALDALDIEAETVPRRSDMKRWFRLFVTLRNKTRGHGATRPYTTGQAAVHLYDSVRILYDNCHLFQRQWAYLHRNISGKYRVTSISQTSDLFDHLKRESTHSLDNGVYVHFGSPRFIPLIISDPEISDFFLPNGGFNDKNFELLSYSTDDKLSLDSTPYLSEPGGLIGSETQGHGSLLPKGNCFTNVPDPTTDYVARAALENDLFELLMDDRHPVITLQGAGGVGKTSATIQVINRLYQERRFELMVWFSARDIDLLPSGPRMVRPGVLSPDDVSSQYAAFVLPEHEITDRNFKAKEYFQEQLQSSDGGSCLFVFDNFETVQNPVEMFTWLEYFIRPPNKILITTRLRDFKGDYPLEVQGMTEPEARTLIEQTSSQLHITHLMSRENVDDVISESGGHPYVIKILLGEVANEKRFRSPRQVVAGSEEILTALFERTFKALSPCGQRMFMTLAGWNSAVPRIALEAVLIRSTEERSEVGKAIESLLHYSLAESRIAEVDGQEFMSLPLAASAFGKQQLQINVLKSAIQADVQILQMFSPSSIADVNLNISKGIESCIRRVSDRIDRGAQFSEYAPIVEMVCRNYNPGWLLLAQWRLERGTDEDIRESISNIESFLQRDQNGPDSARAWNMLARARFRLQDHLGEIHAFVERAQFDTVPFYDVSNTANLLNRRYLELDLEVDGKRQLAQRLLDRLEARISEAKPDDLSRMAWLALHLSREDKATEFTVMGLSSDPDNQHCLRIAERMGISESLWATADVALD